ncbi:MAG: hypothetical protein AAGA27_02765 [Pseudomonadota bacterium]
MRSAIFVLTAIVVIINFSACSSNQSSIATFNVSSSTLTLIPGGKPVILTVTSTGNAPAGTISIICNNKTQQNNLVVTIPESSQAACDNLTAGQTCTFEIAAPATTTSTDIPVYAIIKASNAIPTAGKTVTIFFQNPIINVTVPTIPNTSPQQGTILNAGNGTVHLGQLSISDTTLAQRKKLKNAAFWNITDDQCSNTTLPPKAQCNYSLQNTGTFSIATLSVPILGANDAVINTINNLVTPFISTTNDLQVDFGTAPYVLNPSDNPRNITVTNNSVFNIPCNFISAAFDQQSFNDNADITNNCTNSIAANGGTSSFSLQANSVNGIQGLSDNFTVAFNGQTIGSQAYTFRDNDTILSTTKTAINFSPNHVKESGDTTIDVTNNDQTTSVHLTNIYLTQGNSGPLPTSEYTVECPGLTIPNQFGYACSDPIQAQQTIQLTIYGGLDTSTPTTGSYTLNIDGELNDGNNTQTNSLAIPTEVLYPDLDFSLPTINDLSFHTVTLTNNTAVPALISSILLSNNTNWAFEASNDTCDSLDNGILAPNASCAFNIGNTGTYATTNITVNGDWFDGGNVVTTLSPILPNITITPNNTQTLSGNDTDTFTLTNTSPFILPSIGTVFDNTAFGQNSNVHIANNCNSSIAANGGQCTVDVSAGTLDGNEKGSSAIMQFSLDNDSVGQRGVVLDNIIEVMADSTQRTGAYEKLQVTYTGSSTTGVPINSVAIANPQYLEIAAPFGATPADNCTGETLTSLEPTCTIWLHAIKQNSPQVHNTTVTVHYSPSIGENDSVSASVQASTLLYATGNFTLLGNGNTAFRTAAWNGTSWQALSSGITDGNVTAMTVGKFGNVYIGGSFMTLGDGNPALRVAVWNGATWSPLNDVNTVGNDGIADGNVVAAATDSNGNIYFGGSYTLFENGATAFRIAKWDPNTNMWSDLDDGNNNGIGNRNVRAIAIDSNDNVYVGGNFNQFGGGNAVNRIAEWDGTWNTLSAGPNNGIGNRNVRAIAIDSNDNVYVGGNFNQFGGGNAVNRIAEWDGTWNTLSASPNNGIGDNNVRAITIDSSNNVFTGGNFNQFGGGNAVNRIAEWDGTWNTLSAGPNNGIGNSNIWAMVIDGSNNVYAAGNFTQFGGSGGSAVNRIAKWDGAWSLLSGTGGGNGIDNGAVRTLAIGAAINIQ